MEQITDSSMTLFCQQNQNTHVYVSYQMFEAMKKKISIQEEIICLYKLVIDKMMTNLSFNGNQHHFNAMNIDDIEGVIDKLVTKFECSNY